MHDTLLLLGMLGALFAVPACAEDIAPEGGPDATVVPPPQPGDPDAGPPPGDVVTVRNPDGTYTTEVNAADEWQYVDLEAGVEVAATDAWDLAAHRVHIKVNGGASGAMGGAVAPIAGATLDAVSAVPADGFITDTAELPAFEQGTGWYDYDIATHVLTPFPIVWVVKTADGSHVKLVIETYYDGAGTSGHFTWRWAPMLAGGGS